ncbi:MAG: bifunctional phosphopantothenoylcysteine decarboxylase/phosphopantothenate--cysteine ligase CoaBC [Dehalococcoidia bacterium]|nr:bifunctional phosphopantothenoylcysteine decarboxylase/phosphopantothenate--cysteine ligase CoaBC [Dehalococcoidia bacterium]
MLNNKTVVLGITGSIAAYKAADIASKLTQAGAKVEVVMTGAATKFIKPLTFRSITGRPALTDAFKAVSKHSIGHVALGTAADLVVIAPASAATIAKLAAGICDNMLTLVVMATKAPVILAPAMNVNMFENAANQENLARLKARGFTVVDPEYGRLASGAKGKGRLADVDKIMAAIEGALGGSADLAGKRLVVTAGGTRERIDPVRYIGNPSSGKMGYALAEAARDRGAKVTLITASSLPEPGGITVVPVETAAQMKQAVTKAVVKADALLMAAAVADYQSKTVSRSKIKKASPGLTLELVRTPDILGEVRGNFIKVGFAAESDNIITNAKKKLAAKKLDLIVANDITDKKSGFGVDTNKVTLIAKQGKAESLPLMSKREVADKILDRVVGLLGKKRS